ncbi:MAG: hypothetical protein RL679_1317 [Bacteroidota bacterium]
MNVNTKNMKKLIVLSLAAIALIANLSSCKKGENDPFLSLKSRKARVVGEWTVTKEEGTSQDISKISFGGVTVTTTTNETSTYNGTLFTSTSVTTSSAGGNPLENTYNDVYTQSYTFEKDGSFTLETVYTGQNYTEKIEGTWAFVGKSKTAELKNKEAIALSITKYSDIDNGVTTTYSATGFDDSIIIAIDRLKNKEMVFIRESTYSEPNGDTGSSSLTTTLTAK